MIEFGRDSRCISSNIAHLFAGLVIGFALCSQFRTFRYQWKESSFCPFISINTEQTDEKRIVLDELISKINEQNDGRNLLLIGVMTAQKYLDSRARAIYETWAKTLGANVIFFSSSSSRSDYGLPVVSLPTVDDSYPPQKKSFLMLKFMFDHFIDKYEYFMRADDDVYIDIEKLHIFLRSINSSKPQFIGQAGVGNKEEFGQLNLDLDENFCMGGPGVILSRTALQLVAKNIHHCLKNLYSTHEDVEIGRCVRKFVGIPCTWSYEMQHLFHHNSSVEKSFQVGQSEVKQIHRAITIHPIKTSLVMRKLHLYVKNNQIKNIKYKVLKLYRQLFETINKLGNNSGDIQSFKPDEFYSTNSKLFGQSINFDSIISRDSYIPWDFIYHNIYFSSNTNPRRHIESHIMKSMDNNIHDIMTIINNYSKQRGRTMEFKSLYYGYMRIDPLVGVEFILDLLMVYKRYRGRKMTIPVRRHAYSIQTFSNLQFKEIEISKADEIVNIIVPLSGRTEAFIRFIENFKEVYAMDKYINLVVVLFPDAVSDSRDLNEANAILTDIKNLGVSVKVAQLGGFFSRAAALQRGAALFPQNALLFFIDVDMHFTGEVINRVRYNTIENTQVYFPIVFSQYSPQFIPFKDVLNLQLDDIRGYWRQFGFGIVSIYNSDLQSVGGFNVSIYGWGMEDVNLYDKVIHSNLTIFRSVDKSLTHIFHEINCEHTLTSIQYNMCLGTKLTSLGSVQELAKYVNLNKFLKL